MKFTYDPFIYKNIPIFGLPSFNCNICTNPNNTVSNSYDAMKAIFTGRTHKMSPRKSVVYMAC